MRYIKNYIEKTRIQIAQKAITLSRKQFRSYRNIFTMNWVALRRNSQLLWIITLEIVILYRLNKKGLERK